MEKMRIIFAVFLCVALAFLTIQTGFARDESLVLYLPFDEGAGNDVIDLSDNGNDGVIQGADWVDGQIGKALEFNGSSHVEIPHSESLSVEVDITVMAWTFVDPGAGGELMIVSKGAWAANDLPYELSTSPGGVIYWQFYDDAGRDQCSPPAPPVGEWHHIAATYDGSEFRCFIDGALAQEFAYEGVLPQNDASVTIGRRSKSAEAFFMGMIDEVAIFSRALGDDEIKDIVENGLAVVLAVNSQDKLVTSWGTMKSGALDF